MMNRLLDVYFAKVKIILGAFKASKINLFLVFIYLFGVVIGCFGLSIVLSGAIKEGLDLSAYLDEFSALISLGLAVTIIVSFRGFVVFDYEENLFFTSTITPWTFLAASILSDLTIFSIFLGPFFMLLGAFLHLS